MSDEAWFVRVISRSVSGREDAFRKGVRERDGNCVISGAKNWVAQWDVWLGFEAAHIFPLEHENLWIECNYARWITNMDSVVGSSKINSIQNGLLMVRSLHTRFDLDMFSINPDVSILQLELVPAILMRYRMVIRSSRSHLWTWK